MGKLRDHQKDNVHDPSKIGLIIAILCLFLISINCNPLPEVNNKAIQHSRQLQQKYNVSPQKKKQQSVINQNQTHSPVTDNMRLSEIKNSPNQNIDAHPNIEKIAQKNQNQPSHSAKTSQTNSENNSKQQQHSNQNNQTSNQQNNIKKDIENQNTNKHVKDSQTQTTYRRIKSSTQFYEAFAEQMRKIPDSETYNAANFASKTQLCLNKKPCQFFYYVIPPKWDRAKSYQYLKNQSNIKNILLVSGMHGNQYLGPISLLNSIKNFKAVQTRIIIFPLANPSGFDFNRRLTNPGDVDPNRDFPIEAYDVCYQATSTSIIDSLFRKYRIDLTIGLHNGESQIGWNWGTNTDKFNSHTSQYSIYLQIGQWLKYLGGKNSKIQMEEFKIGTMTQVIYPASGTFDDWAYAGSWYQKSHKVAHKSKKYSQKCVYTPYPDNMTNSLVFLFELGPFNVPQALFGAQKGINMNPTSQSYENGYISRTVRMLGPLMNILNPRLTLKFTNTQIVVSLNGCSSGAVKGFKVYSNDQSNNIIFENSNTQWKMQGNINKGKQALNANFVIFKLNNSLTKNQPKSVNKTDKAISPTSIHLKDVRVEYSLKCDEHWQGKGNTVFGRPRQFNVSESVVLVKYKMDNFEQNLFQTLSDALSTLETKPQVKQSVLSKIDSFYLQYKSELWIYLLIVMLVIVAMLVIFQICKQIRKQILKNRLKRAKYEVERSMSDQKIENKPVQMWEQVTQFNLPSSKGAYPHFCESDKSIKNEIGQYLQLQQFIRQHLSEQNKNKEIETLEGTEEVEPLQEEIESQN